MLIPNLMQEKISGLESDAAKRRLLSIPGDPFLLANWERVLFLHFSIAPELLRPHLRPPLELDLYQGQACVSLVAVTMTQFRPAAPLSFGWLFRPITRQRFLNLRTYVRHDHEPGALFLWGWLSRPLPLPLPTFTLPCSFARLDYRHNTHTGTLSGNVNADSRRFRYRASFDSRSVFEPCSVGSSAHFAMERYTGFFHHQNGVKIFRTWHPAWLQTSVNAAIDEDNLITAKFNWFKEATFVGANFAPGFECVALGRLHELKQSACQLRKRTHGPSALFKMP
jgi:uncharacterized protein YqjF (DUF2071 family)